MHYQNEIIRSLWPKNMWLSDSQWRKIRSVVLVFLGLQISSYAYEASFQTLIDLFDGT